MPNTPIYNLAGQQVGEFMLDDAVYGIQPNETVLHQAVVTYLANQRQGTQSALTRAEVSGGGRKPWKQKGTGRARQGSTRSPQWTHGGIAFGPKPRTYRYTINKKVRRLALYSALSSKVINGQLLVVDALKFDAPKTKDFVKFMNALGFTKALVATAGADDNTRLSARNVRGVKTSTAATINTYDILKYDRLIVDKASLAVIEEVFA